MDPAQQGCGAGRAGLLAGQPVVLAGGQVPNHAAITGLFGIAAHTARQAASRSAGRPRPEIGVLP
jgi:hypothetical protein